MTIDEAKKILKPVTTEDGSLKTGFVSSAELDTTLLLSPIRDTYIDWDARYPDAKISLDGFYSVEELEAMVVWIRRHIREAAQ